METAVVVHDERARRAHFVDRVDQPPLRRDPRRRGEGRIGPRRIGEPVPVVRLTGLKSVAAACLATFVLLAVAVAHSRGPYVFEARVIDQIGPPSATHSWIDLVQALAGPAVGAVLVASFVFGLVRGAVFRVLAYAALAGATLLLSEYVAKPLVHRTYIGLLTFPSGHVTAVTATALAMWLALFPVFGKRARTATLAFGTMWALLMCLAVVGALWHTPVDAIGSLLLSVGVVTAGAVALEPLLLQGQSKGRAKTLRSLATRTRTPKALTARKR